MGLRFLALLALALLVGYLIKRTLASRRASHTQRAPAVPQEMAQCHYCGVYLPRKDAIAADGKLYCSKAHAAPGDHPPE